MIRHHLRPLGRTALGGSCGLFGNGMAFTAAVMAGRSFSAHLTEDLEMQVQLLLDGVTVEYAPEAVVFAEMPTTLEGAQSQNERWERGRIELARRHVPALVRAAVAARGKRRVALLDTAADLALPPLSVIAASTCASALLAAGARALHDTPATRLGLRTAAVITVALGVTVMSALRLASAPPAVYRSLVGAPRIVLWKLALWLRMLRPSGEVTWRRTQRNS